MRGCLPGRDASGSPGTASPDRVAPPTAAELAGCARAFERAGPGACPSMVLGGALSIGRGSRLAA
jgi:hypothetical protein